MKTCVIIYHKNINIIYRTEWIEKCINSILNQTYQDFYIYELNYGDNKINFSMYFDKYQDRYKIFNENMSNHAYAMNFLLDKCLEDNFDAVFNVNLDDHYHSDRFEEQIKKIKEGYDLVSSDIQYIRDNKLGEVFKFSQYNNNLSSRIEEENLIAHPAVCYSKRFLSEVRYNPEEIPLEDYNLWKRIYKKYKFYIVDKILCYYRIHGNQIGSLNKKTLDNNKVINERVENLTWIIKSKSLSICNCGGQVSELFSPNGNKYKMCNSCKRMY